MQSRIAGYDVEEQLARGQRSVVYRAVRPDNGQRVVIKTSASEYPSDSDIARLRQEFDLLNRVHHIGVVRAIALVAHGNGPALILEHSPGETLARLINGRAQVFAKVMRQEDTQQEDVKETLSYVVK